MSSADSKFNEAYWQDRLEQIKGGTAHSSLGHSLLNEKSGSGVFKILRSMTRLQPEDRVVDYGCGSLRIGRVLMDFLKPGHYFGIEPMAPFLEIGKEIVGAETLREKAPELVVLSDENVEKASLFQPDLVVSITVVRHIAPEIFEHFAGNIVKIATAKPNCALVFNGQISDEPIRYGTSGRSWPLSFYEKAFAPLKFIKVHRRRPFAKHAQCETGYLEFRNA